MGSVVVRRRRCSPPLTEAVEAQQEQLAEQSEELQTQRETIQQLIEELRRQT